MRHSAVIFDLFGTLVDNFSYQGYERVLLDMAEILSVPAETFVSLWMNSFDERAIGLFPSAEANIEDVLKNMGIKPEQRRIGQAARIRLDFSRTALKPRHDAVPTLAALRADGLKIGLISDCSMEVPGLWPETPFAGLIDEPVFSCSAGVKKPDPRIYHLACRRLGVEPSECLYVGDGSSQELSGALSVGMRPVLIRAESDDDSYPYRINTEDWDGPKVSSLAQVVSLVRK